MQYVYYFWKSPLGSLFLFADEKNLMALNFVSDAKNIESVSDSEIVHYLKKYQPHLKKTAIIEKTIEQLKAYFRGELKKFHIPLRPEGTDFQKQAWQVLQEIPYGEVISYQEEAVRMQKPKALRAVGQANGKNPIAIIIPCHRVVAKGLRLGGYSGGLGIKIKLLAFEKVTGIIFEK